MNIRIAIKIMLWLFTAVTLFHLSIIFKMIPYEITWGGRLKTDAEMYVFESLSIAINIILIVTLLIKGNYIKQIVSLRTVNIILWVFLFIFGLNTIGNLFANTNFEKLFAILTLASSILIWIILKSKNNEYTTKYKR
jgi:hypothetical protein